MHVDVYVKMSSFEQARVFAVSTNGMVTQQMKQAGEKDKTHFSIAEIAANGNRCFGFPF